ncbi:MAG: CBS domain-containing protein [Alphaproteobacteria bacterium]|nr:CBS domain-containing protein [Alphaproteobacteria bacterium]
MNASEIMTRTIVTVTRGTPIREAIRLMLNHKISGLPVVDATGKVEGILTEGDLLRRSEIATEQRRWPWLDFLLGTGRAAAEYVRTHGRSCEQLMSRDVISVAPETSLAEIVELMERRRIKRLPVIENGVLVGIVSRPDLLAAVARALDSPQSPADGDDAIRERVLAELAKVDWASRSGLKITVVDGIVAFDGVILDEHERGALRVAAENVPGVKGIIDRLVWVEPVSGTVLEAGDHDSSTSEPPAR